MVTVPEEKDDAYFNIKPPTDDDGYDIYDNINLENKIGEPGDKPKRGGCLTGILYFLLIVGVSAALAVFIWLAANDVLSLIKPDVEVLVTVEKYTTLDDITQQLKEAGIINYPWIFKLYCNMTDADEKIKEGEHLINSTYDYRAIISAMSVTPLDIVRVVIPEGYTLTQIFELLDANGVSTVQKLMDTAENHPFNYSFLENLPDTRYKLEGYLFPDTYDFYVGENPVAAINKMLSNFNRKFVSDWRERAVDMGLTIHEALTIASLIERETGLFEERPLVSSVIHNRLQSPDFPRLEIDATVLYCLPEHKEALSWDDTQISDPYNTYRVSGLPPGPICSPGTASIRAALSPDETDYYYYVLKPDGGHYYSRTLEEHLQAIEIYRNDG